MKKYKYDRVFTFDGKRYHVRADTLEELGMKKAKRIQELKTNQAKAQGNISTREWTEKCIETYKSSQSEITRKKYIQRIEHCILEHIGTFSVKTITPIQCQAIINLQSGKSKTQINEVYQALKFIFSHAVFNGLIDKDPTLTLQKPKGYKSSRRALTSFERNIFIKVASKERQYFGFLLMLYCGCRPQEAFNCKGSDIIMQGDVPVLHIRGTKTANADRYVPIPDEFYKLIKDLPKGEYIAVYKNGNKITNDNRPRLWKWLWRKMNIEAGTKMYRNALLEPYLIPKDFVPYCLRHEFCSNLARKGIDIRVAQKLMGHAQISLTANIYTHIDNEEMIQNVAKILSDVPTIIPTDDEKH